MTQDLHTARGGEKVFRETKINSILAVIKDLKSASEHKNKIEDWSGYQFPAERCP